MPDFDADIARLEETFARMRVRSFILMHTLTPLTQDPAWPVAWEAGELITIEVQTLLIATRRSFRLNMIEIVDLHTLG